MLERRSHPRSYPFTMSEVHDLQRTTSHGSSLEKKDLEKNPSVHDIDVAQATGAEFDDPNLDRNAIVDLEDDRSVRIRTRVAFR